MHERKVVKNSESRNQTSEGMSGKVLALSSTAVVEGAIALGSFVKDYPTQGIVFTSLTVATVGYACWIERRRKKQAPQETVIITLPLIDKKAA